MVKDHRPIRRLLKKCCEFKKINKGCVNLEENSGFEAKIKGANSVSGENLHAFEKLCPGSGYERTPHPPILRMGLDYSYTLLTWCEVRQTFLSCK